MSYQRERESFLLTMARHGMSADVARLILRHATTYQRLAERECNGDDEQSGNMVKCPMHLDRAVVSSCGYCDARRIAGTVFVHGKVTRSSVRMTQIERRVRELVDCTNEPLRVEFQGDPRGYCVRILIQDGNGIVREYGVPVRNR